MENSERKAIMYKDWVIWKKDIIYNPYSETFHWMYSELIPEHLTLTQYNIQKIKYRKK